MFSFLTPAPDTLKTATDQLKELYKQKQALRQQGDRIVRQIPIALQRVNDACLDRDRCKQVYTDILTGVQDFNDLTSLSEAKSKADEAEIVLAMRRDDRRSVLDAQALNQKRLDELNESVAKKCGEIRELAQERFKERYSRNQMWKTGTQSEFDWRMGTLNVLLARLPNEQLATLTALEVFLSGSSFQATIKRGFQDVSVTPSRQEWNAELERMTEVGLQREVRRFHESEEITVPHDIPYRMAFDELCLGRLELVAS